MRNESTATVYVPQTAEEIADFIQKNDKLIHKQAHIWADKCGETEEDLAQEGRIAFWKAILTYDPSKGASLTTYCTSCCINAFRMMNRKAHAQMRSAVVISMDADVAPDGKDSIVSPHEIVGSDQVMEGCAPSVEEETSFRIALSEIQKMAHECLSEQEYNVLFAYYDGRKQREIAEAYGLSLSQTSKIVRTSHSTLRWYLAKHGITGCDDFAF